MGAELEALLKAVLAWLDTCTAHARHSGESARPNRRFQACFARRTLPVLAATILAATQHRTPAQPVASENMGSMPLNPAVMDGDLSGAMQPLINSQCRPVRRGHRRDGLRYV